MIIVRAPLSPGTAKLSYRPNRPNCRNTSSNNYIIAPKANELCSMHTPIGAQYCDNTARQYKIRMVDKWGFVKYNTTWSAVTTANQF